MESFDSFTKWSVAFVKVQKNVNFILKMCIFSNAAFLPLLKVSTDKIITKYYRKRIPDKPDISINLWSILKNCIGKELSKIPMPVSIEYHNYRVVRWFPSDRF